MTTLQEKVEGYIKIRDYLEQCEEMVKAQLAPYREAQQVILNQLLEMMEKEGIDNIKTPLGTAYRKIADRTKVVDWNQTLRHIIGEQAWHLLERRVSPIAAQEFLEETGNPVPGVEHSRAYTVQIRRAS